MDYFVWYDESTQKTAAEKIHEASIAYQARFARIPQLVLVHNDDQTHVGGLVVRSEHAIQRNNFWLAI
ncbi:hypothetical protein [Candidatus Chloroploca asiatica]|uniref:Uncharacterized protein n=1 Tax=Candidatus Chloroploca asiatica TaxID=1506545 RepID=A0A2H3KX14_9CHLR|nr:hypothetical protein [Candidatus Chloroploca asiatica]PDV98500.1 hypothetical protein A9Q02_15020 [Candidatus Chloroploca asiatica]